SAQSLAASQHSGGSITNSRRFLTLINIHTFINVAQWTKYETHTGIIHFDKKHSRFASHKGRYVMLTKGVGSITYWGSAQRPYRAIRYGLTRAGLSPAGTRQLGLAHRKRSRG
ncbi:MAG TPA: hypothetical protein VJ508_13430, partial [Saprospiraceae bacterium]|nr:hypothetical protein [Saprospiraceae bacterium]